MQKIFINLLFLIWTFLFINSTNSRQTKNSQLAIVKKLKSDVQLWTNAFYEYYAEDFANIISFLGSTGLDKSALKSNHVYEERDNYTPFKSNDSLSQDMLKIRELDTTISSSYYCGAGIRVNATKWNYYCNNTSVNSSQYSSALIYLNNLINYI